ncbi:hypothetical protein KAH55_10605, partial [bacterium]|nr:hypothetical protein [bacterium]
LKMQKLCPAEEFQFYQEIHGDKDYEKVFSALKESFNVLQVRSQVLLSLITICLTITGFSGHRIASTGLLPRIFVSIGVSSVLISALILICGPLQVRWMTQFRAKNLEATVLELIRRRNLRTRKYHWAIFALIIGLTGYVLSLVGFLLYHA